MLTFTLAVVFLLVTPGPGVLTTAGVGAGFGYRVGARFLLGLFVGSNIVALAVVSGVAAVAFSIPWLRSVLLIVSVAYLLVLAARIALSGSKVAFMSSSRGPGMPAGLMLQLINPKAYAVNTTLFTGFGFWPDSLVAEVLIKFAIVNLIWIPVHFAWLAAGVGLHRLELGPRAQSAINIAMAASMLAVVALALWAQRS